MTKMCMYMCIDASLSFVCEKEEYLYSLIPQGPSARLFMFVWCLCRTTDTHWMLSHLNTPPPVANPCSRAWSETCGATSSLGIAGGEGTDPCCWRGLVRGALPAAPCSEGQTRSCPGVLCSCRACRGLFPARHLVSRPRGDAAWPKGGLRGKITPGGDCLSISPHPVHEGHFVKH